MASGSHAGNAAEIDRLALALAKDPGSKAFIPLAEEYGKAGMWAEAAGVLEDGLKHYPGFITAMVALGRAYDQMGQSTKAKAILEEAVKISPENLRAHRTLAKIYVTEGNKDAAFRSCNVILAANPFDQESLSLRASLGIHTSATADRAGRPPTSSGTPVSKEAAPSVEPAVSVAPIQAFESALIREPLPEDSGAHTPVLESISARDEPSATGALEPASSPESPQRDEIGSAATSDSKVSEAGAQLRHQATVEKLERWLRSIQTRRRDRPSAGMPVSTSRD